ncbi:hypothetical protein LCGC14_0578800 [marine sediment metagenome]|uniref:Radical SAM core domain-containing protein n=1 Tax=marine sediment metagenome TaxID=412755 RepID=A0A0F9UQA9_9ZZZZ|nr:radical SAM protein [archaeon]
MGKLPESINYHITEKCNYCCKFCFAQYENSNQELSLSESLKLIRIMAENGCKKINFAGGEPTLINHLPELISYAQNLGLFVSIISNGTGINRRFIEKCSGKLDLIGLSIDSQYDYIEAKLGRTLRFKSRDYSHVKLVKQKIKLIKEFEIPIKINSIVNPLNWDENLSKFIQFINPIRWKVFEIHHLNGINDNFFREFGILKPLQFQSFIEKHSQLKPVFESSQMIMDSYCMITPDGRFYQDTNHRHHYSKPILDVGIDKAFQQIIYLENKYRERDGGYFKSIPKSLLN